MNDTLLEDLLEHFLLAWGESKYFELIPLLTIAAGSEKEVVRILKSIRDEGKYLKVFYPACEKTVPAGEFVGEIEGGALYLTESNF